MMREIKLILSVFVILLMTLTGCSLLITEPVDDDKVCISKSKLEALNISIDELLEEESVTIEIEEVEEEEEETGDEEEEEEAEEEDVAVLEEEVTEEEANVTEDAGDEEETTTDEPEIITKTYTAGELVSLKPTASDADDDVVTFTYTEPLDENGEWQTAEGDEGEYIITVTASDGKSQVSKNIKIIILGGNAAPVIEDIAAITVTAGDTVTLEPVVSDADGDEITISYSGWMTESSIVTSADDIGAQTVTITASDGKAETTKTVSVTVEKVNHAPVLAELSTVTVKEGELVELSASASDEDGDDITITFSEPLDADGKWQTAIDDAGTYTITVTASDGKLSDEKTVAIVVNPANSAPVIEQDDRTVIVQLDDDGKGTETVTLNPTVTDADGDEVTVTYSGFMDSNSKVVSEADEGEHIVTITADDSKVTASLNIKVTVELNNPVKWGEGWD